MKYSLPGLVIAVGLLSSCTVGPNYARPQVPVPANFRAPEPLAAPQAESLADLKWFEVFKDEKLQELTRTALVQNYDLRDAVARVEEARANLGVVRSNQFPQASASGNLEITRLCRTRIATGARDRSTCCRLSWTFGAASAGPRKPPARIC
jgi:multidrug efflux system outer membrane protein